MFTEILVPYDGSEPANKALAAAIELGTGPTPITITVLRVANVDNIEKATFEVAMRIAGMTDDPAKAELLNDEDKAAYKARMKEKISGFFSELPENIDVKIVIKRGDPRDVICNYAKENDTDCVIMGRRGLSGIRATLGSVSTAVLRGTDLPVMVVR